MEPVAADTYGQVIKGFHDMFPYVNQYWALHLVESFKEIPKDLAENEARPKIYSLLLALARVMSQPAPASRNPQSQEETKLSLTAPLEMSPSTIDDLPPPIPQYIAFKGLISATKHQHNSNNSLSKNNNTPADPTFLSAAFTRFQKAFEAALDDKSPFGDSVMGVSPNDRQEFKFRHKSGAYLCRWSGCVWSSTGFRSLAERMKHETCHEQRYLCSDPTCDFALGGFMSRQALRKHCQRYHTSSNDVVLPKFPGTNGVVNVAKKTNHLRRPILRVDTNLPLTPYDKSVPSTPTFSLF